MNRKTWFASFKDPRWQKKRLEVMRAAGFKCDGCGDGENTLAVHHGYYEFNEGRWPWEYENETLHCLCEDCHLQWHKDIKEVKYSLAKLPTINLDAIGACLDILGLSQGKIRFINTHTEKPRRLASNMYDKETAEAHKDALFNCLYFLVYSNDVETEHYLEGLRRWLRGWGTLEMSFTQTKDPEECEAF
jgi:hypothetical protein